jgi:hypothetical protein
MQGQIGLYRKLRFDDNVAKVAVIIMEVTTYLCKYILNY